MVVRNAKSLALSGPPAYGAYPPAYGAYGAYGAYPPAPYGVGPRRNGEGAARLGTGSEETLNSYTNYSGLVGV